MTASIATTATTFPGTLDSNGVLCPDFNAIPARMGKHQAAAFVSQFYFEVSFRTLERWPLPKKFVNGANQWRTTDLASFAKYKLKNAVASRGVPRSEK
jgi:hypothetical protein